MENTVKFDPGIGELVVDLYDFTNYFYSQLAMLKSKYQKNTFFYSNAFKLKKYIKNNICFYTGCLLWAYYIKNENTNTPKEIEGNVFYNLTEEELKNYDYLSQVKFLGEFFNKFEKDVLIYTGKKYQIPAEWRQVLNLYTEFLSLNKGFVKTKMTSDIELPELLTNLKFDFDINALISRAISEKNLEILSDINFLS